MLTNQTNLSIDFRPRSFAAPMCARLTEISALPTLDERYDAYADLLQEISRNTRDNFRSMAEAAQLRPADMFTRYGIPYSFLSKMFDGSKTVSTCLLSDVCDNLLHTSVNQLVFGEPSRILIPNALNAVVLLAEGDPSPARKEATRQVLEAFAPRVIPFDAAAPIPPELVYERLRDIARDTGMNLGTAAKQNVWSSALPAKFRLPQDLFELPVPSIKRLAGYCFRWNKPIDYFIARDYTRHSSLYYRNGDRLLRLPEMYDSLVSVYLRLSQEDRERMTAELLALSLAA